MENENIITLEMTQKFLSDDIADISKALTAFQSECPTIQKNTKGYGYKYADLAVITETIKPHLKKADLSYTQPVFDDGDNIGVITILTHGKSGQFIKSKISADLKSNIGKGMNPVQSMGSIITYLRRYSLSSILGIVTDEDTDGVLPQDDSKPTINKKSAPAAKETVTWLTEEQFKKALESGEKGIAATLKAFSTKTKKMKAPYKKELEAKLKELKDGKDK